MKLSDIRLLPSINEELDTKFYALSEIETSYNQFKSHQTEDNKFVDLLLSDEHYNSIYSSRSYRVKTVKTTTGESIDKMKMDEFSHGATYEVNRTANHKGTCKELVSIMLNRDMNFNYGSPFTLEQLAEEVSSRSKYRPKPRTISRRFTDLRLCDVGFSICYFKGKVEVDDQVIKDNFYILADNCRSDSGLIKKHEMIVYQSDYEYLSWFDEKEDVNKGINNDNDTKEDE